MRITIGMSIGAGGKAAAPELPSGYLGAWDFTDSAATASNPITGLGSDTMTLPSSPNDPAVSAQGLDFDATDDYAQRDAYALGNVGTLIVVAHTALTYPSANLTTRYRGLIGKTTGGGGTQIGYSVDWQGATGTRNLRLLTGDTAGGLSVASISFNFANAFHCIGARWNGSKLHLFDAGAQIKEGNQTCQATGGAGGFLRLGQSFAAIDEKNTWDGTIAFAAVYDRALSDAEMVQAYQALKLMLAPAGISI